MQVNGSSLLKIRIKKGISQYRASVETGVTRSTINRIESGRIKNPSFNSIAKLCEYYDITMESIKQE